MQERIQKILSRAGIASRRAAEQVMSDGRVTVNGETVRELGTKADVTTDDIRVDGVRIRPPADPVYLLLYKPRGVVTTRHDPEGRATVMGLVPPVAGLFPVGRLDVGTEGLIILTNDGNFAQRVSHPRYEVPRVYQAKVRDIPSTETLARLTAGVRVEGERLAADHVRLLEADNNSWLEITLHEGKNHEVRRLMEAVGHPVSKLKRVAIGPVTIRGLNPGQFRHLTPQEVRGLTHGVRPAPRPTAVRHGDLGSASARPSGGARRPSASRPPVASRPPAPSRPPATARPPFDPRAARPERGSRPPGRGFGSGAASPSGARSAGTRPTGTRPTGPRPSGTRPFGGQRPAAGRRPAPPTRSDEGQAGSRRPARPAPGRPARRPRRPPR
jgi:23S rRNA pseudouridine2605 synthase